MRTNRRRRQTRGPRAGRRQTGFVMMEVIVSLVILGISIATLMRSFTISMSAIRKNDITTQACVLAEGLMQEFELTPPTNPHMQGSFEEQGFPKYSWTMELEEENPDYRDVKVKKQDLKPLRHMHLTITYDDQRYRKFSPIQVDLYLPPVERFSWNSKFLNELFKEEGSRR